MKLSKQQGSKPATISRFHQLLLFCTFLFAIQPAFAKDEQPIIDSVHVIDGGSLQVGDQIVRLWGIHALKKSYQCRGNEGFRHCGLLAARVLNNCISTGQVMCEPKYKDKDKDKDKDGTLVALCHEYNAGIEDKIGQNPAECVVRLGYAADWPQHSKGRYAVAQKEAMDKKNGAWEETFLLPKAWGIKRELPPRPKEYAPLGRK